MSGPANSPLNDPAPFQPPVSPGKPEKVPLSDWARLGKSRKYPSVNAHLEARKEYWRHYLPGGAALREVAITDPQAVANWVAIASAIIDEIDTFQYRIQREKDASL